jgi:hypothetical protein
LCPAEDLCRAFLVGREGDLVWRDVEWAKQRKFMKSSEALSRLLKLE